MVYKVWKEFYKWYSEVHDKTTVGRPHI